MAMHKVSLARTFLNVYNCISRLHAELQARAADVSEMQQRILGVGQLGGSGVARGQREVLVRALLANVFMHLSLAPNLGQAFLDEAFPQSEAGLTWEPSVTPLDGPNFPTSLHGNSWATAVAGTSLLSKCWCHCSLLII